MPSNRVTIPRNAIPDYILPKLFFDIQQDDQELFEYCRILFLTGLRGGDACNLKYSNIEKQNGIYCFVVKEGKLAKYNKETIIPIHPELQFLFLKLYSDEYILNSTVARKYMVEEYSRRFKKYCPDYTPYHFRHTFATELSKAGVEQTHIKFLMGKLLEGTINHYLKKDIETLFKAINLLVFPSFFRQTKKAVSPDSLEKCL